MPRTPSGKLDRRTLAAMPALRPREASPARPLGPVEEALAQIWCEVIEHPGPIDAEGDFFRLGGHSLASLQVVSRVQHHLGVRMPISVMFDHPRLGDQAAWIERALLSEVAELSDQQLAATLDDPGGSTP